MKTIVLLMGLLAFNAFAGDSYFVCEDIKAESFMVDEALDFYEEGELITASFIDKYTWDYKYAIAYNHDARTLKITKTDLHMGTFISETNVEGIKYYEPVVLDANYQCFLTD
jgi:hypothetical protein